MPFMLGENVGAYRLIEQLGQGGMATVYKAYHARLDRYVAIKALHPAFMADPNFEARFQREARVVAKMEHPNIVPIYDFAEHDGRPYLVLKYVEGETLKARLLRDDLTREEIQDIFEAVSSGLSYAHGQGILHRDVKPSNVLLADDGRIYLADFGLARMAQAGESTLSADMMLGTPQYISPEQAKGLSDLDQGTDIYSLGVMMYELLVGRVPFSADTPFSIIHDHIYSPLPLPHEVNPNISPAVERVLLKALAKDREDRYQDIASMSAAFQKVFGSGEEIDQRISLVKAEEEITLPPTPAVREVEAGALGEESSPAPDADHPPESSPTVQEPAPSGLSSTVPAAPPSPAEEDKEPAKPARKRRIPSWLWWMVLPALILCFLGGIVLKNAMDSPGPEAPLEAGYQGAGDLSEAKAVVEENPDDPRLRMELAAAYWREGQYQQAKIEANKAFDLAQGDPALYKEFGDMLAEEEIWIYATLSYALAETRMSNPPEELYDLMHQAMYFAAFNPVAEEVFRNSALEFEPEMLDLVNARAALMNEDFAQVERFLNAILEQQTDMPEAHLLEADFLRMNGESEAALQVLRDLEAKEDLPDWIKVEIQHIREEETPRGDSVEGQRKDAEAVQAVSENPDDPMAHANLAIVYWEEGRTYDARDTAYRAFELIEGDPRLCLEIGNLFAEREIWLLAAPAYLLAEKYMETPEEGIYDLISEAVYFAAFEEDAMEVLGDPNLELGLLLMKLVEARHEMVVGNLDRAEEILNAVLERKPDMLEAHLLEADLLAKRGELETARSVLLELQREENLPDWIRIETQNLWRKLDEQK